ncbi:hypothetical protein NDU88_002464 [Pleurodeles waltl]|uniref:Uncharacterized protein n=1 Tax=Pleurodeles waltl TaxID=8319 RepID=A0AAV7LIV9_PLEWA|nr:hypothetical protein NDU88_002464 [Pleurodeles waltl]
MEQLLRSLHEDFTTQKQEIAIDLKDLKREVIDLGQLMDTIQQTHDAQEEEMDCQRRGLLTLQDKNQDLQYQIEDLENRSRHSSIQIKGAPAQAVTGTLEDFVVHFFCHMAPALKEQNIVLDRTDRAGRPAGPQGQAQDILTCLHHCKQRLSAYEDTLTEIRDTVSHFLTMKDTPTPNIATLWETLKAVVRGQFMAIAARHNALRHNEHKQLENGIQALAVTHRQTGSLAVRRQLITQHKQLRALNEDKAEYALLHTKQKFYAGGTGQVACWITDSTRRPQSDG